MVKTRHTSIFGTGLIALVSWLSLSCVASCSKEQAVPAAVPSAVEEVTVGFAASPEDYDIPTRSRLTAPGIETLKSNVYLAAYYNGRLCRKQYFDSNLSSMQLKLEKGNSYTVYALVNGNGSDPFTEYESALSTAPLECPPYALINANGIPMAGKLTFTALSGNASGSMTLEIPVKRLFAKVTATIHADWAGAVINNAQVRNLNRSLVPFGTGAWDNDYSSLDDYPTFYEVAQATSGTSSSMSAVFYIPENMQGDVFNVPSSSLKTFDGLPESIANRLSYMVVYVSSSGLYTGSRQYRCVLGMDSCNNCDIKRNCSYVWNLTLDEDGLVSDEWKNHPDSWTDNRYVNMTSPVFVERVATVPFTDFLSTNVEDYDLSFSVPSGAGYSYTDIISGTSSAGVSVNASEAMLRKSVNVHVSAQKNNPGGTVSGTTQFNVIKMEPRYMSLTYSVNPGSYVDTEIAYGFYWPLVSESRWTDRPGLGSGSGREWSYTATPATGITSSYTAGGAAAKDKVRYTVPLTVAPGDYPVTASRVSGLLPASAGAVLHVNDTRYLRWQDKTSSVNVGSGNYNYASYSYSEATVHVYMRPSSYYAKSGTYNYAFLYFDLGDISGSGKIQNATVTGSNIQSKLKVTVTENSVAGIPLASSEYFSLNSLYSSSLWLTNKKDLPAGLYGVTISFPDDSHPITAWMHVEDSYAYELVISDPSGTTSSSRYELEKGYPKTIGVTLRTYVNGTLQPSADVDVTSSCTFTASNACVSMSGNVATGMTSGNVNITANYSSAATGALSATCYVKVVNEGSGGGYNDDWD